MSPEAGSNLDKMRHHLKASQIASRKEGPEAKEASRQHHALAMKFQEAALAEEKAAKKHTKLVEARRDRALDRGVTENGEYMTRRQWVERKVAEGEQPHVTQEDKIKPMSRMQVFRATNEEQRAHDRRVRDAGKKDVYWIGNYEVTKTEHDYAVTLKETPRANESKPAAQGSESAPKPDTQAAARAEPEPVRSDRDAAPVEGGERAPAGGQAAVREVGPFKYGEANREAKRLTAETGVRHDAVEREHVDAEGFTVAEWFAVPAKAPEPKRGMTLEEAKAHVAQANIDRPLGGTWEDIARKQGGELNMKGLHAEPGKPPTPVTEPVIAETVRKAVGKTTLKPSEIKAKLLAAIDGAMSKAKDEALPVWAGKRVESPSEFRTRRDAAIERIGIASFDIPGDGRFKVLNTRERLAEFRKQVETSPGFKDRQPKPFVSRPVHSTSLSDAIKGMIDDGDPQAAVDYAAAKGLKIEEVLAGDKKRLARVSGVEPTPEAEPGEMLKAETPSTGAKPVGSPEALDTLLREKFGSKLIEGLHEQGILKYALARDEGQTGTRSGTKAVLRQRPGERPTATLYFDRLTPEQAPAALLHELGEHFGIVRVLGTERYNVMLNELRGLRDTPEVAEAWKHVERNYVGENTAAKLKSTDDPVFIREVAAKLVEDHPDLPFVRRLINEIRAFLYEHFGTTLGNRVDANLIRGMAASALRKAAKGDLPATPPVKTFRPLVRTSRAAESRAQP